MSCDIGKYDICMRTGRDFNLRFVIKKDGVSVDIASAKAQVRAYANSDKVLLELPVTLGVETGEVLIGIPAAEDVGFSGGVWDLRLTLPSGEIIMPLGGKFEAQRGVTRGDL